MAFDVTADKLQERLDAIEGHLPESFFPGLSLADRVERLVEEWRRMLVGLIPHAKVTKDELIGYLAAMQESLAQDDSFEGSVMYSALEEDCAPGEFKMRLIFRVGNSDGQGSMMMLGVMPDGAPV